MDLIYQLLQSAHSADPHFPPTLLYNEGWLLRIILDWFSTHLLPGHPLDFPAGARWFSEAYLPSAFAPRYRGDKLGESSTHADGVIGHFKVGERGKADLTLLPDATHFVVLEAKLSSKLSSGVSNAPYYDQAARNVACIAETLQRAGRNPRALDLGFYLLASKSQIDLGVFKQMQAGSIQGKVKRRVMDYDEAKDVWYAEWFLPTLEAIQLQSLSWESLVKAIETHDPAAGQEIDEFYRMCLEFN
jgi:hypothetical protein